VVVMRWFLLLIVSASAVWAQSSTKTFRFTGVLYAGPSNAEAPPSLTPLNGTAFTAYLTYDPSLSPYQESTYQGDFTGQSFEIFTGMGSVRSAPVNLQLSGSTPADYWSGAQFGGFASSFTQVTGFTGETVTGIGFSFSILDSRGSLTTNTELPAALNLEEFNNGRRVSIYFTNNQRVVADVTNIVEVAAVQPGLAIEQPVGSALTNSSAATFPATLLSTTSRLSFVVRNTGTAALTDIALARSGVTAQDFSASAIPAALDAGQSAEFVVSFSPSGAGSRTTQFAIVSNDTNNSPFIINLSGFGLSQTVDTDQDGLNDAAEYLMSALGFNWRFPQQALVSTLFDNASVAGLYTSNNVITNASSFGLFTEAEHTAHFESGRTVGRSDVTDAPASFSLFTQLQYDDNRARGREDGRAEVIEAPESYGLYDSTSIMDLRMGGLMIQKQGTDATIVFQPQTTTDLVTLPFTNTGTPITNAIPMPGDKGFLRVEAIYVPANDLIDSPPGGN